MKIKACHYTLFLLLFYTNPTFGYTCPELQDWKEGDTLPNGWQVLKWTGKPILGKNLIFQSAWLFEGRDAECHYEEKDKLVETKLLLHNRSIVYDKNPSSHTFSFKGGGVVRYYPENVECIGSRIQDCDYVLENPIEPLPPRIQRKL